VPAPVHQVDGAAAAEVVLLAVARQFFSCEPQPSSAAGNLATSVHGPVLTNSPCSFGLEPTCVSRLGDVDGLDAEPVASAAHSSRVFGSPCSTPVSAAMLSKRLLYEVRDEARVRAVGQHAVGARLGLAQRQRRLAQRVVGAADGRPSGRCSRRPRLDAGVEYSAPLSQHSWMSAMLETSPTG